MAGEQAPIAKAEFIDIRKAFPHEAHHFSAWLAENLDTLGERLGITLELVEKEKAVGEFNVDLLCEDDAGRTVIIENQLERTDHDHLGKVLTYLVNLDAKVAVWVTTDPRPEHERVIEWLNEVSGEDISFYLVQVEAVKIGDSPIAPLFTVVAAPDVQIKETGEEKKEWAERQRKRYEFWTSLLQRSKGKTTLFSGVSPGRDNWISTGAGKAGISYQYAILMNRGRIELYIDRGAQEQNKAIFDALHGQKENIEREFDGTLDWWRLDDKRACGITKSFTCGGLIDYARWPTLQDEMIDAMIRFDKVFRPRLQKIEV